MEQEKLFKLFCGTDKIRPVMLTPFEKDEKVYATNSYVLIRCDKSDFKGVIDNPHKALNAQAVFPKETCNRILLTKYEDYDKFKTEDELVEEDENVDCPECDGEGEVTWEYESYEKEDECPVCDGSGLESESRFVPNGNKTFSSEARVKIDYSHFDINVLKLLFEAQKIIGGEIISLNFVERNKPALFRIGIYEVLIMPVTYNKDYDFLTEFNLLT